MPWWDAGIPKWASKDPTAKKLYFSAALSSTHGACYHLETTALDDELIWNIRMTWKQGPSTPPMGVLSLAIMGVDGKTDPWFTALTCDRGQ